MARHAVLSRVFRLVSVFLLVSIVLLVLVFAVVPASRPVGGGRLSPRADPHMGGLLVASSAAACALLSPGFPSALLSSRHSGNPLSDSQSEEEHGVVESRGRRLGERSGLDGGEWILRSAHCTASGISLLGASDLVACTLHPAVVTSTATPMTSSVAEAPSAPVEQGTEEAPLGSVGRVVEPAPPVAVQVLPVVVASSLAGSQDQQPSVGSSEVTPMTSTAAPPSLLADQEILESSVDDPALEDTAAPAAAPTMSSLASQGEQHTIDPSGITPTTSQEAPSTPATEQEILEITVAAPSLPEDLSWLEDVPAPVPTSPLANQEDAVAASWSVDVSVADEPSPLASQGEKQSVDPTGISPLTSSEASPPPTAEQEILRDAVAAGPRLVASLAPGAAPPAPPIVRSSWTPVDVTAFEFTLNVATGLTTPVTVPAAPRLSDLFRGSRPATAAAAAVATIAPAPAPVRALVAAPAPAPVPSPAPAALSLDGLFRDWSNGKWLLKRLLLRGDNENGDCYV
ncbi:hypothetical protein K402DRAFT_457017 [Aulographum hederae CBS 113979]|uniref:Uncharacterized protein n=1 Tax=Aulographum hederae CBS 113979 TaxID=1176131 RepID=A0A6G1GPS2_9PEZI|nr:hypothetical protein K402DRAFT_457017 [Aulographum hederae CBS 113979]